MKKTIYELLLVLLFALFSFSGCGNNEEEKSENTDFSEYLVVLDKTGMVQKKVEYDIQAESTINKIEELLEALNNYTDSIYTSPLSEHVKILKWEYSEGAVSLYFGTEYYDQFISDEVMARSAIVETLCQLDDVEDVSFYIEDAPLTLQGTVIGRMNSNSFLYDTSGPYETTSIKLYFPDDNFEGLVEIGREVDIDAGYTDEQLVLEELLKGPTGSEAAQNAIPQGTKLLNIVTKDMVCYVNLSVEFLNYLDGVSDELTVYSIVNSLSEVSGVRSVVISVDGQKLEYYRGLYCGELLTCNYDLLLNKE
ncbi:MAG: GerMN domain-containing protein [Lachnospiraceae bacterium]